MPLPYWVQPTLSVTSIVVAIFREEILAYKTAAKEGIRKSRIRRLNERLAFITSLQRGSTEGLAGYLKNVMVYMIVIIFLPTSSMTDKVAGQYAMLAQIIDIVFICLLLMIFISVFSNVSDVAEYATFKAKTVAKIIKLGGVVIEPERPNRKRRATTK